MGLYPVNSAPAVIEWWYYMLISLTSRIKVVGLSAESHGPDYTNFPRRDSPQDRETGYALGARKGSTIQACRSFPRLV